MPPPTDLPVEACIDEVRDALGDHGHAVLQAEPGAGKTTIVPLRLLDEPWLAGRRLVVLEPRRMAARAAARRMAALVGEPVGRTVGWRTRDDRRISAETRLEVVTEGILTAWMVDDPSLASIGLIAFDEFHERSLPGDLGLALALDGRDRHGLDARLLVMSATLDGDRIAEHIGRGEPAPIITSEGRSFSVDIRWRPRRRRDRLVPAVVDAIDAALREDGDVLVFLPGVGEILNVQRELRTRLGEGSDVVILPLHGSLPADEQDAAIVADSLGRRRVVLATDVAETSLTVEGVRVVVDAGLARVPRHDPDAGMTRLQTVSASRASVDQRAGRAGRTEPGLAIRLWSKVEHGARPLHRTPTIEQIDLTGTVLDLARRGRTDPADIPFLDPPPEASWTAGRDLAHRLGLLDDAGATTPSGDRAARLPLDPRLGVVATALDAPWTACVTAALLEDRDILRGRPSDLPTDVAWRAAIVEGQAEHPAVDRRGLERVQRRAGDLVRRLGQEPAVIELDRVGPLLARGFPDRVARARRGTPGRFVLADGTTASLPKGDALIDAAGLVVVELSGRRNNRIITKAARLEATVDHLVYATPDLEATIAELADGWGVTPVAGGRHPGFGTANALLRLGRGAYLEVIGPDPDRAATDPISVFGIGDLDEPRLVTWAIGVPDIDLWVGWARNRGVDPGDVLDAERTQPNGETLRWRMTLPAEDGVLPFLIQWPAGDTPADSAPGGCELMSFTVQHPDPAMASRLAEHAVPIEITTGPRELVATVLTPNGIAELRG